MKRFYKQVSAEAADAGYVITLDDRLVKTPGRETLVVPTRRLAAEIAAEWEAQEETIDPRSMHLTLLANTTIDRVSPRRSEVIAEVGAFAGTDLLCYRADEQEALLEKQDATWTPYLEWAKTALGADLKVTRGIMPVSQQPEALAAVMRALEALSSFELTVAHALTNGFGSVILALAFMRGHAPMTAVWAASILDTTHQEDLWGEDWETADKREATKQEMDAAARFLALMRAS